MCRIPQNLRDLAAQFQTQELKKLAGCSYSELASLPQRTELRATGELVNEKFCIRKKEGSRGSLEISVLHYDDGSYFVVPDYLKQICGDISIGEGGRSVWFDISPSGVIEWPDLSIDGSD